ncbi:MAG: M48 family metallopeptidase, partial [Candidatus Dormibacteraeota bacterium]|nr:M48 family metallopeptidase [Candidatus Dormibacteraeota bacterium]
DYLLVHELAHLRVPSHGPRFWELVNRYPLTERARGYLMALDHRDGGQEDDEAIDW